MQIVGPADDRSLTSYKDELRWRKKLQAALDSNDLRGELNARKMLNSIFMATNPAPPPEPSMHERFGHGAATLAGGVNQLVPPSMGGFTPEQEQEFATGREMYRRGLPADTGVDWPSLAGEAAMSAPLMLAPQFRAAQAAPGLLARTAAGAGSGAAAGGLLFAETPTQRLENMIGAGLGGAAGGAVLPPLVGAAARGKARLFPAALPPDAQARQAAAAQFGFTDDAAPTTGRLLQSGRMAGDETNIAKLPGGERLATRFGRQREVIDENLARMQDQYGGPTASSTAAEAVESAVQQRSRDWQTKVRDAYAVARAERPDAAMPGDALEAATADVFEDFELPAPIAARIQKLSTQEGGIAPGDLEKLDKLLTRHMGKDRPTDTAIGMLKQRVRGVIDEAGDAYGGAYRDAVGMARERFDAMGEARSLVNQFERGQIDPIHAARRLNAAGVRDLTRLRDFVAKAHPEAWQALRASVMTDLAEQAMPSGNFSQAAYNRAVKKLTREKAEVLFGQDGAKELFEFGEVTRDLLGPLPGSTANTSNTAIAAARLDGLVQRLLRATPLVGDIAQEMSNTAARRVNARAASEALLPGYRAPDQRAVNLGARGLLGAPAVGGAALLGDWRDRVRAQ